MFFILEHPLLLVAVIVLTTALVFCVDSYFMKKNQQEYAEEFRIFCLFLQSNSKQLSHLNKLELLDKAKIYSFKYGHLPKSKRPKLMSMLKDLNDGQI